MNENNIIVKKTGRYFTLGEITDQINSVWFLCHGYGQLAKYFLRNFEILNNGKNLLVAPEGLHRFYLKGYTDRVGASWMTKEDRLNDIKDYTNFLDDLYKDVLTPFERKEITVNVLGFSQGAATVSRWLANNRSKAHNLILWAGAFPEDLPFQTNKSLFDYTNLFMVFGDEDEFITSEQVKNQEKILNQNNIKFELIRFNGKHEINSEVLKELEEKM